MKNQLITNDGIGTNINTGNSIMVKNRIYTVTGIASRSNEGGGGIFKLPKVFTNIVCNNERGEKVIFAAGELVRVKAVILSKPFEPFHKRLGTTEYPMQYPLAV